MGRVVVHFANVGSKNDRANAFRMILEVRKNGRARWSSSVRYGREIDKGAPAMGDARFPRRSGLRLLGECAHLGLAQPGDLRDLGRRETARE